ncbi:MAG: Fe-S cluster biosynthesis and repair protein YggX [Myxococcota bacterium]|jgi:Fe-S cluster biosynthesis and repair protein YggX
MSDDTPKTVLCSRLQTELPAITGRITFAGDFGARILAEVSQKAWAEWMEMQIKVINEYRLHLGEPSHRQVLQDSAGQFFRFDGGDGNLGAGPEGGMS